MTANPYIDESGRHIGYCEVCGRERELDLWCPECGDEGWVVPYDDDPDFQEARPAGC
jgi:hypothetical protein